MRTVSIRELANETTAVIQETVRTEQPALITNRGKPVALLIPVGSAIVEDAILAHAQEYVGAMVEADNRLREAAHLVTRSVWQVEQALREPIRVAGQVSPSKEPSP